MGQLNKKMIQELAKLCRISCDEEEQDALLEDLKEILGYIDQLKEIDTEQIAPCNQVIEDLVNVERQDLILPSDLSKELFLAQAPEHIAGMVRVPTVIKNKKN
ncbi:MAG: gatC [Chlamydiales bacterium]|jgi:aspartyl-tRNA(Asn)/glutamyl-tRNA(Gln) amidotransferase subunit C|nr:gatC [Chlamydiales bacterium]